MAGEWQPWIDFSIALAVAVVAAMAVSAGVALLIRIVFKRADWLDRTIGKIRRPFRALLVVIGVWVVVGSVFPSSAAPGWQVSIEHLLRIAVFAMSGWLLIGIVSFLFGRMLARYPVDVPDNRVARRIHTQVTILRRVSGVIIVIVTVGAILLTFPGVQALGASLLASAGLAGVVAGLAVQSTLANVFAGLQLAFSDAIRVDDVVIVEDEWGRIDEITLTYIVVRIWDDRRLILPSTYFTTTPFQNWTRSGSQLMGSVEFDLDWRVSPAQMRAHLEQVLENEPLWDRRSFSLQITDATHGFVRVRIVVTADNSGALWDMRCNIREAMVEWLHQKNPAGLPRGRVQLVERERRAGGRAATQEDHSGLFSGSADAQERGQQFTQSASPPRG